jgi:hypothetical protein
MFDFLRLLHKSERFLFNIAFIAFLAIFSYIIFVFYLGLDNVIHWDILGTLDQVPVISDSFFDGKFNFQTNGIAYLTKEQFLASAMQVKKFDFYLLGSFYLLGLCFLLTAISHTSPWIYRIAILVLAGIILTTHTEIFGGNANTNFLVIFIILACISYYFHDFNQNISSIKRFLVYAFCLMIGLIFVLFSKTAQPFLAFTAYAQTGAILLTLFFIFFISHENIATISRLVSSSSEKGKNYLTPLLILSSIYLLNLLVLLLRNTKVIEWDGWLISPFIFFFASLILGFKNFRDWCESDNEVPLYEAGLWIYSGFALISTVSIAFAFATGNDPLIEAFEDAITYSHLLMGFGFVLYLLINFWGLIKQGLGIHRVLFKPLHFQLYGIRLVVLIAIVTLLSTQNYFPFYQTMAGIQNTIGDYYNLNNEKPVAEAFYKNAITYEFQNHKSNYALASLAMEQGNRVAAGVFFKEALRKNPSAYAYAGLSRKLLEEDAFFEALFTLRDGLKHFPKSGELQTNLAFLYEKSKMPDSVQHYLSLAVLNCKNSSIAENNLISFQKQELIKTEKTPKTTILSANELAICKIKNQFIEDKFDLKLRPDSALGVNEFAYLYNHFTRKGIKTKNEIIEKLLIKQGNENYTEDLLFAQAFSNYYNGKKIDAMKAIINLASDSTKNFNFYNRTAGIWFLQEGIYGSAMSYLKKSGDNSTKLLENKAYQAHLQTLVEAQADIVLKAKPTTTQSWKEVLGFAPFNAHVVHGAVEFFNQQKQDREAYQILFDALEMNPTSAEIRKKYVLQCLQMGLKDYATEALEKLSPADYQAFKPTYQATIALIEKQNAGFQ